MGAERNKATDCPHNVGLVCDPCGRDCVTCGWSPEVDARRRQTLREQGVRANARKALPRVKKQNYHTAHTKVCEHCGESFDTPYAKVKYCCEECRSAAVSAKLSGRRKE